MTASSPPPSRPVRLADRLLAAKQQRFVGRVRELELFRSAVEADEPPFAVLYLYGPGGVGKTTLVDAYARLAAERGVSTVRLDGRSIDPSPAGFLLALQAALGSPEGVAPLDVLARQEQGVLLLDTYELLSPLDAWIRETFLPQLPSSSLVVIAGRNPPAPGWRVDPGWNELVHVLPLRNLRPEESRAYLSIRGVSETEHPAVLAFTHGHPLALSLVADVLAQVDADEAVRQIEDPDVVRVLLERFVQRVPSSVHRRALDVSAHVRITTERLLAEALGVDNPQEIFSWMRELSFMEHGPYGLFPHDLVREVLDADLRWRNPDEYRELHRRVRGYIVRKLQEASGLDQQRAFFDLLYLHRSSPIVRPYFEWSSLGTAYAEPAAPADFPAVLEMVRRHEGKASAEIARYWLERQPHAFTVFRSAGQEVIGFIAAIALHETTSEDRAADPAIDAAWNFALRYGPPREGERMLHHRFSMTRDTYQLAGNGFELIAMRGTIDWMTTPGLSWSFLTIADAAYWNPLFSYLNLQQSSDADFEVGERRYAVFTHDWRAEPPLAWLDLMAEREIATNLTVEQLQGNHPPPLIVLSEPEFAEAIRQALRDFTRPHALATSPLLSSKLVTARCGTESAIATLQTLIREAVETLKANPKDERLYRAIHRTYLAPAATQELAAESLGLPFSTYRYQLTTGIERITAWLWQRELYGSEATAA